MIVVKVELWSAVSGQVTELARMEIANDGTGDLKKRHYDFRTLLGRSATQLNLRRTRRSGRIENWPSERLHVWNLVAAVLKQMGYGGPTANEQQR